MKHVFRMIGLISMSLGIVGCTSSGTNQAEIAAPAAPSSSAPVSSFKETAKADRENRGSITPYPFTTCAVIRKDLEGTPNYRRVYKNQEVLFCCLPCISAFDSNPEAYMPRIVAASAAKSRGETVNSGW